MTSFKPVTVGLSVIVVVGIVVGLVIGVHNARDGAHDVDLDSVSKPIAAFCLHTDYKHACVNSLRRLNTNDTATPKDYLLLAINTSINAIKTGIKQTKGVENGVSSQMEKDVFEDCRRLLGYAVDELGNAFSSVENAMLEDVEEKVTTTELNNWLSATIAYQQACLDIIENGTMKKQMVDNGLRNSTELSSNILAMVSDFSKILESFGVDGLGGRRRRLLGVDDSVLGGFPWWMTSSNRMLLMVKNVGQLVLPNAVVAQDGSVQFKTINSAIDAYPKAFKGRYVIFVKAGIYNEQVVIPSYMQNVFMYGDGPRSTIVTGSLNNAQGTNTFRSASFGVIGDGFICKSMGFQNTAGPNGHQAVALRVQSDTSVFYNCRIDGFQSTLYTLAKRQFYRNCFISGTIDFIFGDGAVIIQNSLIVVRHPRDGQSNTVTAQGKTDRHENTGIVIQNCRIVPDQTLFPYRFKIPTYLGRPWKQYSTTVIMESVLGDFIQPVGWMSWPDDFALDPFLFFAEYSNKGPGADSARRVNWKGFKVITDANEAMKWTVAQFLQGQGWISESGTPFLLGLKGT